MLRLKKIVFLMAAALIALGLAGAGPALAGPKYFSCTGPVATGEIAKEAKVVTLYCFFKKYKKVKSLHVTIGVKNVCKSPKRFRVNIFLPNGRAVGGLIPRKTKKGLIKPGGVGKFTYPFKGYGEKPKGMEIYVRTIGG